MKSTQTKNPPVHENTKNFSLTKLWFTLLILASFSIDAFSQQNSLLLDGINDHVTFSNISLFDNSQRDFTVEIWYRSDSLGQEQTIFSAGVNVSGQGFMIQKNTANLLEIETPDGQLLQSIRDVNDTLWHHVAVAYEGSDFSLYLDGALEASATYNISIDGTQVQLGQSTLNGGDNLAGWLDQLRIWSRALSRMEIIERIFEENGWDGQDLWNYYDFNQNPTSFDLIDQIGAEDGTLQNMTGNEWVISDALVPHTISSVLSGAWSNPSIWSGGKVPSLINEVTINGTDSVYLDSDVDVTLLHVTSSAAFDQRGFNILVLQDADFGGNYYANATDSLFFMGYERYLNGGFNDLPLLYLMEGSLINLQQDITTKGGVFVDNGAVYNSFGYNTTLTEAASWDIYGHYEHAGDTIKFNGLSHTVFGGTFETVTMDTCTLILLDTMYINSAFVATGAGTLDMGTNVMYPGYEAVFAPLDTIIWSTGASIIIDQFVTNFQTGYILTGPINFEFPTIEILTDGELDLTYAAEDLPLAKHESLIINGGVFFADYGQGIHMNDSSTIQIYSGKFEIGGDGAILFGTDVQIINDGGDLKFGQPYSTFNAPAVVQGVDVLSSCEIIQNSGNLSAEYTRFKDLTADGIAINGGNVIKPFNNCTFLEGLGSSYITINSNALDDQGMDSVGFFVGPVKNITKTSGSGTGTIYLNQSYGNLSGPAYDSIQSGNISWLNHIGDVNYGLAFDGIDDHVTFATSPTFPDSITVEGWIYVHDGSAFQTLVYWDFGGGANANLQIGGNYLRFNNDDGAAQTGSVIDNYFIPNKQWVHIAAVIQFGNTVQFYVNGIPTNSGGSAAVVTGTPTTTFGSSAGVSNFFYGIMDDFRIWQDDLNAAAIQTNMNATLIGNETSLQALYDMSTVDPTSDTVLLDLTSNVHDGVLNFFNFNTISGWVASESQQIIQQALNFGGSAEVVTFGGGGPQYNANITLEAWIRPEFTGGDFTIASWDFAGTDDARLQISNGDLQFVADNGTPTFVGSSPDSIKANQWHHVAVTKAGSDIELYINGKSVGNSTLGTHPSGVATFTIGAREAGGPHLDYFDGDIDEMRVWNTVVSQNDLRRYALTEDLSSHPNIANLEAHITFNDGTVPESLNSNDTIANDLSINAYEGDLVGGWILDGISSNWVVSSAFESGQLPALYGNGLHIPGDSTNIPDRADGTNFGAIVEYDTITNSFLLINEGLDTLVISDFYALSPDFLVDMDKTVILPEDTANVLVSFIPSYPGVMYDLVILEYTEGDYAFQVEGVGYPDESGPGYAITFNGIDQYVEIADDAPFTFTKNDPISMEAWVYPTDTVGIKTIIGKEGMTSGLEGFQFRLNGSQPELVLQGNVAGPNAIQVLSQVRIDSGRWNHVAVTYDGTALASGVNIYINGIPAATTTVYDNIGAFTIGNTEPAFIGGLNGGSSLWDGKLDEIRIWNSVRSQTEIEESFLNTVDPGSTDLGAYYRADFGIDTVAYDLVAGLHGIHKGTPGTFVFSHAPMNNEQFFDSLFDKTAIWESNLVASSANLQIAHDSFLNDEGDNIVFAHDNIVAADQDLTSDDLADSGGLISRRMVRTWYVEISDSAAVQQGGEIDLIFDNVPGDSTYTYYLLGRIDEVEEFIPLSYSSIVKLTDSVGISVPVDSIPEKAFFTLGMSNIFPGNAIALDGVDDTVRLKEISYGQDLTFEFWGRFDEVGPNYSTIFRHGTLGDTVNCYIDTDGTLVTDLNFTGSRETLKGSIDINDNVWHHIAITRNNTGFKMYIDGAEDVGASFINGTAGTISAAGWNGDMFIGVNQSGNFTNLKMDEFRIWNTVRDSAQINENMFYPVDGFNGALEAYYRFDQFAGYNLPDQTGSARVGTLSSTFDFDFNNSGWIFSDGFEMPSFQHALDFDGTDDYVSVPNIPNYDVADTTDFTIEAWIQGFGNADGTGIITMATNANPFTGFSMIVYHGRLAVEIGDGTTTQSPATAELYGTTIIDDGDWHHIALAFHRSTQSISFFVDGIEEFSITEPLVGANLTSGVFNIGTNYDLSLDFNGVIDDVRFWSFAKGDIDIQNYIYDAPVAQASNLEAYFDFNQGEIGADNSAITSALDRSANYNDGTLNGFALTGSISNFVLSEIDSIRPRLRVFWDDAEVLNYADTLNVGLAFLNDTTYFQLTLVNVGNDTLNISSMTLGSGEYGFSQTLSDSTLLPYEQQSIELFAVPTAEPFSYSSIDITSNDPLSPFTGDLEVTAYPNLPGSGTAISLNGSASDYAVSNDFTDGFGSFSVEFWAARADTLDNDVVFSSGTGGANNLLNIGFQTGQIAWFGFGSDELTMTYGPLDTDWNHWAFTYDSSINEQKIYLNGIEIASRTSTDDFLGAGTIFFGRTATGGDDFGGEIDELRFWSYALPDSIIRQHLASKITGGSENIDSLTVYYRFDETSGSDILDIVDGFDFTLVGGTRVTSGAYLGDNSLYNYSSNEIDVSPNGEPVRVTNVSNFTNGFHAYVIKDQPVPDTVTGFQNITDTTYYGVFAPGSTFDLEFLYSPTTAEDSLRLVRRENNGDSVWLGASGIFNLDVINDSIFSRNQTSGEFAYALLNYPVYLDAGDALDFDGVDDFVDIPHDDRLNIAEGDFTLEAWIYLDTTGTATILSKGHGNGGTNPDVFVFQIQSNKIALELSDGASHEWGFSNTDVPQNKWVHVATSFDNASRVATFYLNGSADGQHTYSITPGNNADTNSAFLGKQGYGCDCSYFKGQIDEVRVWNSTLGADTISMYAFGALDEFHPNVDNLVLYQKLDDGPGSPSVHDLQSNLVSTLTNMDPGTDWVISGAFSLPPNTVITTADSGAGSLRAVLDSANTNAGLDTIYFDLPGNGPWIITLQSSLVSTDSVIIDGTTQPGYDFATGMLVEIHDSTATFDGLEFVTNYFELYGMRFNGLNTGVLINSNTEGYQLGSIGKENIFINNSTGIIGLNSSIGLVEANYIGLDYDSLPGPNMTGVMFNGTSTSNIVGGVGAPNIIAYNTTGVVFDGASTIQNQYGVNINYCNGVAISLDNGAQNGMLPPTISTIDNSSVNGTGTDGEMIDVYIANDSCSSTGGIYHLGNATVSGGTWTVSGLSLIEGDTITAVAFSGVDGSSAFSAPVLFAIDPITPSVDSIVTNTLEPVITGTFEFGTDLDVTIDGATYILGTDANLSTDSISTWTLDLAGLPLSGEGVYDVGVVSAKTGLGVSASDSTLNEVEIDLTLPVVAIDSLITNVLSPELTGTVDDITALVDVDVAGNLYSATNNGDGTWTLSAGTISPDLTEGTYDIIVNSTDPAGNVGVDTTSNELIIDTTAPVVTVDTLATADFTPDLTGTVDDNDAAIDVTINGGTYEATNNMDGTWILPGDSINPALTPGVYDVVANATDKANNLGSDVTVDEVVVSAEPVAYAATLVNVFDFTANWSGFDGVAGYSLEVANDSLFTQYVSGYENFVTTDSIELVTGLNYSTDYYYRVRTIISPGDTSTYSNTISVKTGILSGTIADSVALRSIYLNTNGVNWTRNANWLSSRVEFWENITFVNGRVTGLDLSANNLTGNFPAFTGEELDQLQTLLLNDNELNNVADLTTLSLTDLQVQNNNLGFETLEVISGIPGTYSPQDFLLDDVRRIENEGDNITLDRTVGGTANTYQWFKNSNLLAGETAATLELNDISFGDEGLYHVEVQNTIATGITLVSKAVNLKVSSIERDTTALRVIYEALDGDNWTNNDNWFTSSDIGSWDGITTGGSRITGIDLSNNNLGGTGIMPEEILDIINVTNINLSNNRVGNNPGLIEVPDFSSMPNLTELDIRGNSLQFGSIEPIVGNIATFTYNNQAQVGNGQTYSVEKGTTVELSVSVSGENNTYQWRRNGTNITGANDSTYTIAAIDYSSMGNYDCVINNTVATALQITSRVNKAEAHVDIDGSVFGNGAPLSEGVIHALKIVPNRVSYDTTDVQNIVNGSFVFENIVLGDYVIAAEGDTSEYLPTYYISAFTWTEADTLFLRDTINGFEINMQAVPGEQTEFGDGGLGGFLEDDLDPDNTGRLEAGRRVKRAGVMLRRRPPDSRTENDEGFVLFAYVQTDDNGEFTFEDLPAGTYRINFEYPGVPMDLDSFVEFVLGADGSEDSFTIQATVTEDGIVVVPIDITRVYPEYFKNLKIYPNPAYNHLYLRYGRLNSDNVIFSLYDATGALIRQQKLEKGINKEIEVDLSDLEAGMYIINFSDRSSGVNIANARIIKN